MNKKRESGLTLRLTLLQANVFVPFHSVKPHLMNAEASSDFRNNRELEMR